MWEAGILSIPFIIGTQYYVTFLFFKHLRRWAFFVIKGFVFVWSYSQVNLTVVENISLICIHSMLHPFIFEAQTWVSWGVLGSFGCKKCSRKTKPAGFHVGFKAVSKNWEHSRFFWKGDQLFQAGESSIFDTLCCTFESELLLKRWGFSFS